MNDQTLRADYDSLLDTANTLGRENAELRRELVERADKPFDKGYDAGKLDARIEILARLRANANATGLPACHDCVIDIANWLDPFETPDYRPGDWTRQNPDANEGIPPNV
jgi:hypothetical protein